jgi:hypothetical protein
MRRMARNCAARARNTQRFMMNLLPSAFRSASNLDCREGLRGVAQYRSIPRGEPRSAVPQRRRGRTSSGDLNRLNLTHCGANGEHKYRKIVDFVRFEAISHRFRQNCRPERTDSLQTLSRRPILHQFILPCERIRRRTRGLVVTNRYCFAASLAHVSRSVAVRLKTG